MRSAPRAPVVLYLVFGLFAAAPLAVACGGSSGPAMSPAEQDKLNARERLQGHWRLDSFTPTTPLGPPFDSLLQAQIGQLELDVQETEILATGAGIEATRRYQIIDATPLGANLQMTDDAGVHFDIEIRFRGADIDFTSKTSPWQGQGSLSRAP